MNRRFHVQIQVPWWGEVQGKTQREPQDGRNVVGQWAKVVAEAIQGGVAESGG